jgi:hypothetical protein
MRLPPPPWRQEHSKSRNLPADNGWWASHNAYGFGPDAAADLTCEPPCCGQTSPMVRCKDWRCDTLRKYARARKHRAGNPLRGAPHATGALGVVGSLYHGSPEGSGDALDVPGIHAGARQVAQSLHMPGHYRRL